MAAKTRQLLKRRIARALNHLDKVIDIIAEMGVMCEGNSELTGNLEFALTGTNALRAFIAQIWLLIEVRRLNKRLKTDAASASGNGSSDVGVGGCEGPGSGDAEGSASSVSVGSSSPEGYVA